MATDRATKRQRKREERERKRAGRRPSVLVQEFWNLPNMLTLARIAVIPVFVWFISEGDPFYSLMSAAVFAGASITDVVDGYLARRWNMITVTGKLMDPLADKLIAMAAFVMLVQLGRLESWVVIILLARELIVSGLRMIAATEGMVIAAGQEGKWKTSVQLVAVIALCIHYPHPLNLLFATYPVDWNQIGRLLMYGSMVLSVWSAANYFRAFLGMLARRGSGGEESQSA